MKHKILVCGGRDFNDQSLVRHILVALNEKYGTSILIHGGARGADSIAGAEAKKLGWWVWPCEAEWNRHGKAAGPIRNKDMVESSFPDLVIAFPGGKGTADMVQKAKELKIRGAEVVVDGEKYNLCFW